MASSSDLIVRNQILAAQRYLEDKAKNEWHQKWGFYLDFDKIILEEARRRNLTEEEYKRMATKRKNVGSSEDCGVVKESGAVPKTSAGFVGWRSDLNIDKLARPYHVNPKYTLPEELHQKFIILG